MTKAGGRQPHAWQKLPLKRALRPGGRSASLIKGDVSPEPAPGLVPGYSASGQDVWLEAPLHSGPGLIVSAVGARCGKVFEAAGSWGVVANTSVLLPQPGHDAHFLWYLTNNEDFWEKGGTAQPYVRVSETLERRLPIPPLGLQRTIADFLDTETARIDAVARRKGELAQLLLMRWTADLCATLLPKGLDSSTGRPNEGQWVARPMRRLLELSWGGDWGEEPGASDADLPCVRAADFDFVRLQSITGANRSFTHASASTRGLHPGDLVIEKSGGGEGVPVGRVVAWRGEGQAVPTNFAGGLRPGTDVDPDFVLLAFRAAYEVGLPWRSIKQTTGLQNLDLGHYLSHHWPVPSLPDQRAIARDLLAELDRVLAVQEKLREQIALLLEHRQALITAAVTGELEVPGMAA